jgi:hypothetical protein
VRYAAALGATAVVIGAATACSTSTSDEVAVRIGRNSISKATVDHWIKVEAVISQQLIPQRPVPPGLIPDPPEYAACINYLQAASPKPAVGSPAPSKAQLKRQCQQRYAEVRQHVLALLTTFQWLIGESTARGIKLTDGEVRSLLTNFKKEHFTSAAGFQKYLQYSGQSLADLLLVLRANLATIKLQQQIAAKGGPKALAAFSRDFPKKWVARTDCSRGYVTPNCRQYKGSQAPEVAT